MTHNYRVSTQVCLCRHAGVMSLVTSDVSEKLITVELKIIGGVNISLCY